MNIKNYKLQSRILRSVKFPESMAYFSSDKATALKLISTKKYRIEKDDATTYRTINHWSSLGLLNDCRKNEREWRRFSFSDIIWLKVISELRKFGFPLEKIWELKKCLIDLKKDGKHYPLFEYYITQSLLRRPVFLLVYENGFAEIGNYLEIELMKETQFMENSQITISLNNLVRKVFPKENLNTKYDISLPINKEELNVIQAIRSGEFETIEITTEKGKINLIKNTREVYANKERLKDIMSDIENMMRTNNHQSILIQQNGTAKPSSIKATIKKKF